MAGGEVFVFTPAVKAGIMTGLSISQNFLYNKLLVKALIEKTDITKEDLVLDIGAGKGIISEVLSMKCRQVLAFELDPKYANNLRSRFLNIPKEKNIEVLEQDFLKFNLASLPEFKVFSNIPFNISSEILRKILLTENGFTKGWFVLQKETANRYLGLPFKEESLLSLIIKPFYKLMIMHEFSSKDFRPMPKVKSVLLGIERKRDPDITLENKPRYFDFIAYLLNLRKPNIKNALLKLFTYKQIKMISKDLKMNIHLKPSNIEYKQYINLFKLVINMNININEAENSYLRFIQHYIKLKKF